MKTNDLFVPGKIYKRSSIHQEFGGSGWSGISPCARYPYIFIFSVPSGKQHGYKDGWLNEAIYTYTGEGQEGDMQFERNNLALLQHKKNAKRVFLFVGEKKSFVRFEAELEFEDFGYFPAPDSTGRERIAIRFFLKRLDVELPYKVEHSSIAEFISMEPSEIMNLNAPNVTERQGLVTSRVGQGAYRKSVLFRWNYRCAVTGYDKNEVLIASHILPWKDASNEQRVDVSNGILLSPTYDALFDQHLISFENTGKILLSEKLLRTEFERLGVSGNEKIVGLSNDNQYYLDFHRAKLVDK